MKKTLIAAAVLATSAIAAPAFAENTFSLAYSTMDIDPVSLTAVTGRYSWNNGLLGVEGEAHIGVGDDLGVELSHAFGVFGTIQAAPSENTVVFARVGYATAELEAFGTSASETDVAYGVGAAFYFDGANGLRLDYLNFEDADIWSIGYTRRFGG